MPSFDALEWRGSEHSVAVGVHRRIGGGVNGFYRCTCRWSNVVACREGEESLISHEAEIHLALQHDEVPTGG